MPELIDDPDKSQNSIKVKKKNIIEIIAVNSILLIIGIIMYILTFFNISGFTIKSQDPLKYSMQAGIVIIFLCGMAITLIYGLLFYYKHIINSQRRK